MGRVSPGRERQMGSGQKDRGRVALFRGAVLVFGSTPPLCSLSCSLVLPSTWLGLGEGEGGQDMGH